METANRAPRDSYLRRRKQLACLSVCTVLVIAVLLTLFVWSWLSAFSRDDFRAYIRSFGPLGWLVLLGLQFLQVFIALIPGELLETAAGYAFGPWAGTLICYAGVGLASGLIFLLTRRYGIRLVEVFISREKINALRFLNTARKQELLVFILYFIPGTPKDLLTYFVGLTDMKLSTFLILSMIARIPSVISSTFGGHLLGEENYRAALVLYGVTGLVSLLGLMGYHAYTKKKQRSIPLS